MAGKPAQVGAAALLERDAELARIDELIAASIAGEGHFLVIEGRSGMGKTSLLAQVRTRAQRAGMSVCAARGSELESDFAFGVARQLFEPLMRSRGVKERSRLLDGAAALAAPVLGLGEEQSAGGLFAALHGLYWLAADVAATVPLLLVVDDAHWADQPSLRWLAYLLNRLEGLAILVAVGTRPAPSASRGELVAGLMTDPAVDLMHLRPLGERSVAALVAGALGAEPDSAFTAACHRATAGNPLVLHGVIRDLAAQGARPTASAAAVLERQVPVAVSRRLLVRLGRLGDRATRFARGLAVMGDGSEVRQVAGLMELDEEEATAVADELAAADILDSGLPPRFVHPLLRAAVYDSIPVGAQSKLHCRAGDLLSARGADPEAVAAHLMRCRPEGASETLERLQATARAALCRGAPEAGVAYLRRGLADDIDAAARVRLLIELGRAELLAGYPAAAEHLQEAVDSCPEPIARGRARKYLADAVVAQGDRKRGLELRLQALSELGRGDPDSSERIEVTISIALATERDAPTGTDPAVRLGEIAAGDGVAARTASVVLAWLLALRAESRARVLWHLDWGLNEGTFLAKETSDSPVVSWVAAALIYTDELVRAIAWARDMQSDAAARGSTMGFLPGVVFGALAAHHTGLLADTEAGCQAALELAQPHDFWWTIGAAVRAANLLELGRTDAALATVNSVQLQKGTERGIIGARVLMYRGYVLCAAGRRDEGIAALRACGEIADAVGVRSPIYLPWRSSLAMNLPAEAREEARSLAAAELVLARGMEVPRGIGAALRALATLERDVDAVDLLREAVAVLEPSPSVLELARAQLDLGAALRRLGHRIEARRPLREALEIATRCGAVPLAERAREESLLAGARPRRGRLRGLDALTAAELRVARLAAEGRSNREIAQLLFITTKTVGDHLGSSYGKLGVTSRTELTAALAGAAS